ncbi:hypothetical protein Leryth_011346 [Lithospermum erythrorhizon]|nr:hypothetical protein Leryth_011346 [Lithospermum erythrorhizon]
MRCLHKLVVYVIIVLTQTIVVLGEGICDNKVEKNKSGEALRYKLAAIASILTAGAVGVSLPLLARKIEALRPENDIFFMIKAFAAGVILATGFIHILPDAFEKLTSPCLDPNPWGKFPFTGFIAMMASIGALMVDTIATTFYEKLHFEQKQVNGDEEVGAEHVGHVHVHSHASYGHAHGAAIPSNNMESAELMRQRVISQVLEMGIVVHSVIIGISLGASGNPDTIKPLLAALSFHQFFEGMGLGSCISQAKFKTLSTTIMAIFFSLTTPVGIGIGIGISSIYNENGSTALIVEGVFNSASAGILIYMALVDLLAADFMSPRMQSNIRLQLGAHTSLLLGAGLQANHSKHAKLLKHYYAKLWTIHHMTTSCLYHRWLLFLFSIPPSFVPFTNKYNKSHHLSLFTITLHCNFLTSSEFSNLTEFAMICLHKLVASVIVILIHTIEVSGEGICDNKDEENKSGEALRYKLVAIASILTAGAIGVSLPLLAKKIEVLKPENDIFFMIKAFAAGVILATGFLHILPDAFRTLTSPCLDHNPWGKFPFTGFIAMMASIGTLMVDTIATTFYEKMHSKQRQVNVDEEVGNEHVGDVHTHASHVHGATISTNMESTDLMRQRVISQVLEMGIVVHSVIIGISLGASGSPDTIKPLLAALSFHQFFEGMGLGSCISQAQFKTLSTTIMAIFFSLTTPIGIGIGIGISNIYNANGSTALIVEGVFNSASAGILIYMALVDLLAADFMSPRMRSNIRLQLGAHTSLLLGSMCMSFMARWA